MTLIKQIVFNQSTLKGEGSKFDRGGDSNVEDFDRDDDLGEGSLTSVHPISFTCHSVHQSDG